ncbi:MAG: TrkA family potassium uptake protein [Planctomycetes bacterium]|nr:TrkA family potassium uptake protein [Planctomycetota bacterium]
MKYAVIGLGSFGTAVARRLHRSGKEVIAVDHRPEIVEDLKNDVGLAVCLDATDERDLRAQGIDKVDVFVAAIGQNFEANVLAVVLARQFGIPRIVARATSPIHERILRASGATEVVLPEDEAAERVYQRLVFPSLRVYFELIDGFSIAEIDVPADLRGRSIADVDLRRRYGVNLIAIKRKSENGKEIVNAVPAPEELLEEGDVLAIAGEDKNIERLVHG